MVMSVPDQDLHIDFHQFLSWTCLTSLTLAVARIIVIGYIINYNIISLFAPTLVATYQKRGKIIKQNN
jgi:hypothetical protein